MAPWNSCPRSDSKAWHPVLCSDARVFDMALVAVDVLHSLDLGVSQDTLGNFFQAVLASEFLGNSR